MNRKKIFMGIDIGGTKISGALVTEMGRILLRKKTAHPQGAKPEATLLALVDELIRDGGIHPSQLAGIGAGFPGIVSPQGEIVAAPNLPFSQRHLGRFLTQRYKVKTVVGNDVNVGLLGEYWLGIARRRESVIGIFPGTGIGGAVMVGGRLLAGAHGAAGEFGHMMMDPHGPKCHCGNKGCLEAFAGRWAIERDVRARLRKGKKSKLLKGKLSPIKSKLLAKGIAKKDPTVLFVMTRAARMLGLAAVSLRHLYDPELMVFGGGVIEACGDFILPIVRKAVKADPFFQRLGDCEIAASALGDDAVLLGAVALIKNS
jgi:glucokinase